jgi:hypothetical protein
MLLPLFLLLLSILSFFYPAIAKKFEEVPHAGEKRRSESNEKPSVSGAATAK